MGADLLPQHHKLKLPCLLQTGSPNRFTTRWSPGAKQPCYNALIVGRKATVLQRVDRLGKSNRVTTRWSSGEKQPCYNALIVRGKTTVRWSSGAKQQSVDRQGQNNSPLIVRGKTTVRWSSGAKQQSVDRQGKGNRVITPVLQRLIVGAKQPCIEFLLCRVVEPEGRFRSKLLLFESSIYWISPSQDLFIYLFCNLAFNLLI